MKTNLLTTLGIVLLFFFPMSPIAANDLLKYWSVSTEKSTNTIDHDDWQYILDKYLIDETASKINLFNYQAISPSDKQKLAHYLKYMRSLDPRQYTRAVQKAYWINLYNALTAKLIIDNYPVKSITKLGDRFFSFGPWDDDIITITGQALSLNDIEHKILRPIFKDNRIHYAVNCASLGCPNLSKTVYTAQNMEKMLETAAKAFVNHPRGVRFKDGKIIVSSIYHWYKEDFGNDNKQLLKHLIKYADPPLADALTAYTGKIDHDYDWRLNNAKSQSKIKS